MPPPTMQNASNCLHCGRLLESGGSPASIACNNCQWVNIFEDTLPDGIPPELVISHASRHAFPAPFLNPHVRYAYPRLGEKQRSTFTSLILKGRRALTKSDQNRLKNFFHWGRDGKYRKQAWEYEGKAELYEFLRKII